MESFRNKQLAILKFLIEADRRVNSQEISEGTSLSKDLVDTMLIDFKKQGWASLTFGITAEVTPSGVIAYHKWNDDQVRPTMINNTYNNWGNFYQGGDGNTFIINQTNNSEFDNTLRTIVELIQSSKASLDEKKAALGNVHSLNEEATQKPSVNGYEKAKLYVTALEVFFKGTDVAQKASPYFPIIWAYIESWKNIVS